MNEIDFYLNELPLIRSVNHCIRENPFIHQDRILDFHDMVYLVKGTMQITEDDISYELEQGSLLFLKAGLHHWGERASAFDTQWYYVHFNLPQSRPYECYDSNQVLLSQEFLPEDHQKKLILPKFKHCETPDIIEKRLASMVRCNHSADGLRGANLNVILYDLLLQIYKDAIPEYTTETSLRIQKIIHYLETQRYKSFNSQDLADHMRLSYKHLGAQFKACIGITMQEYHSRIRMNEAACYLRETDLPINEISERMGFNDPFYFSNVFRKIQGTSPRAYKKSMTAGS